MSGVKRTHRVRFNTKWHARYLTFSTFHRLPLFTSDRCCRWFADALVQAKATYPFELWGYVLMPDHCHLLVYPHAPAAVSRILYRIKKAVSNRAIAWLRENSPGYLSHLQDVQPSGKECYRFWQRGGGYDRNIWTAQELHEKRLYIHNNPVRAGLVARADQWYWSSRCAWKNGIDDPLKIDRETFWILSD